MRETRKRDLKSPEVLTFKVDVFVMNIPCTNTTGLLEGSWWDGAEEVGRLGASPDD